jgi:glutaredoxin
MNHQPPIRIAARTTALALGALLAVAAPAAHALYKVVGPDGKITYTDRAPVEREGKVVPLNAARSEEAPAAAALPAELRQVVARFPAVLYTNTGACEPCEAARQLLRQRGVPYSERQVQSGDDNEALQRLTGGAEVPVLTLGSQTLRGLSREVWAAYLDAAGYPRESRLPASYRYPAAAPITERRESAAAPAAPAAPSPVAPTATTPAPGNIKF